MEYKQQILEGLRFLMENEGTVWLVSLWQMDSRGQYKTFESKSCATREIAYKLIDHYNAVPEVFKPPKDRNIVYWRIMLHDRKNFGELYKGEDL